MLVYAVHPNQGGGNMPKTLNSYTLAIQNIKMSRLNRELTWLTNDTDALYDLL